MKRNKITLLLAAFLLECGCSDFEEINVNPNNPPTVPANLLLLRNRPTLPEPVFC